MDFKTYLEQKKIDPIQFEESESKLFKEWGSEFEQMNEKSFTARKLFSINKIRRKYKYKIVDQETEIIKSPVRPVIKPKIKR